MEFIGTKKVTLRDLNSDASGTVFFNISLEAKEGDAILGSRTHGGSIPLGADAEQHIKYVLGSFDRGLDLTNPDGTQHSISYPALSDEDVSKIKAAVAKEATPERMAALAEKQAAEQAELEAEQARQKQAEDDKQAAFDAAVAAAVAKARA